MRLTERKLFEERLLRSGERLRMAVEVAGIGTWDDDLRGNIQSSDRAKEIIGLSPTSEISFADFMERVHVEDRSRLESTIRTAMSPAGPHEYEIDYRIYRPDKSIRWVAVRGKCLFAGAGSDRKPERLIGTMLDITERKQAETALWESQARLSGVIASAMDAIITVDEEQKIVLFNAAAESMFRCRAAEAVGQSIERFIPQRPHAAPGEQIRRFGQSGVSHPAVGALNALWAVAADGGEFETEASISQVEMGGKKLFTVILRDITERQQSVQELRRQQEAINRQADLLRIFVEHAPAGLAMFDREMCYVAVSHRWCKDYSLDKDTILGKSHFEVFPNLSESWKEIYRRGLTGEVLKSENDYLAAPDGKGHWIRWELRPWGHSAEESGGVILFAEDVTEHRALERQFLQAQKMEAVGQLAGGVAHDFNNLLMVMKSYGQLIGDSTSDSKIRKYAEKISEAAEKAAAVTKQLLAFSRKQPQELSLLDMNLVVSEFCAMLPNLIGEEIELVVVPSRESPVARVDRGQLEQVIMNLAVNARDAMPTGGRLTIQIESAVLDASDSEQHGAPVPPGEYVVLTVTDTGSGMDEETKARVFEPFFTTKDVGKGSGLGLAMVYGIVKQSNGFVWVYSELGIGTTFKIYLPKVREAGADRTAPMVSESSGEGTETILLVEDKESLREVIGEYLTSKGYQVLLAKDGIVALQLASTWRQPIHLLLTDVVMPRMRGPEVVRKVSGIHSETKAMYMSGYADLSLEGGSLEEAVLIAKPINLTALARKIRQVLDQPAQSERAGLGR